MMSEVNATSSSRAASQHERWRRLEVKNRVDDCIALRRRRRKAVAMVRARVCDGG